MTEKKELTTLEDLFEEAYDFGREVTSRDIAVVFGKDHGNVVKRIRNLEGQASEVKKLYKKKTSKNSRNREKFEYVMGREGFVMLVMSFVGDFAVQQQVKLIHMIHGVIYDL